jgi:hypothetical protein
MQGSWVFNYVVKQASLPPACVSCWIARRSDPTLSNIIPEVPTNHCPNVAGFRGARVEADIYALKKKNKLLSYVR